MTGQVDPAPAGYGPWLASLKQRVRSAQLRAHRAVNTLLIQLYWDIGHDIVERQARDGWGLGWCVGLPGISRPSFPG
jgi:hypothetical protein